jgi:flavin reductase (DIM6/NTAB) family NADH-FMN oxidoreductase RutF
MARYSSQFPDPVVLITVATATETNVMTVGWATPISFEPPILAVSIAPERYTHDLLLEAGEFGVSILSDEQKELATAAGTLSGADENKLDNPVFKTFKSEKIDAPHVSGARAWLECKLHSHQSVGDHTVFFGEVIRMMVDETKSPLVLFNQRYFTLGREQGLYP